MSASLVTSCFCRFYTNMSTIFTPIGIRGMTVLDREKFLRNIKVPILKITQEKISKIIPVCKPYLLKLENFKPVQQLQDNNVSGKCIYLNPEKITYWTDIPVGDRRRLEQCDIDESCFEVVTVQISYDNWKFESIFKAVLPQEEEIVSGFSQIGHIIHLNLREHLLDYKQLIGQVFLDKVKTCRTVVNKSNVIDNTFRNFKMEVIAGEEDFIVIVKENQCNFQFDFSKVYWNPRLGKEHERILSYFKKGDVLFDIFCGVGPFSIPAAKRKCYVFANDLNPDSFKWLNYNAKINKVDMSLFKSYNKDGKDFIYEEFKDFLINYCNGKQSIQSDAKIHVTMNLPALACEFLKYFNGLMNKVCLEKLACDIIVYVFCFVVGDNPVEEAKKMVSDSFGKDISELILDVFNVRNVSPKKEMMRVRIKLTKEILFDSDCTSDGEPPIKKKLL